MTPASQYCELHQCLHGYSDGHRLLVSSVKLPETTQAALLVLSDVPDGVSPIGFVPFLTGCSLPGTTYYGLSRTWPATEMPRPGCVWTHTILVPIADLGTFRSLEGLAELFRRPTMSRADFNGYRAPLAERLLPSEGPLRGLKELAPRVLGALYGIPGSAVRVDGSDTDEFDRFVLALWSQQWPKLRRAFAFRTAITSVQARSSVQFDLTRGLADGASRVIATVARERFVHDPPSDDDSVRLLAQDLYCPGEMRRFLWAFGADAGTREACLPLMGVYRWLKSEPSPDETFATLNSFSNAFPEPHSARRLKRALVTWEPLDIGLDEFPSDHRVAALMWMCAADRSQVFGLDQPTAEGIGEYLWSSDRETAITLSRSLAGSELTASTILVLDPLFTRMDVPTLLSLGRDVKGLVYTLVSRHPLLAAHPGLWQSPGNTQEEAAGALNRNSQLADSDLKAIARAMLASTNGGVADLLNDSSASRFVGPVLDVAGTWSALPEYWFERWLRLIQRQPRELEVWLRHTLTLNAPQAMIALPPVRPMWSLVEKICLDQMISLVAALGKLKSAQSSDALIWLFVAGSMFEAPTARAVHLASFESVYWHAHGSMLSPTARDRLDRSLPDLGYWHNWDYCLRLSSMLATALLEGHWTDADFIYAVRSPDLIVRVLHQVCRVKGGKRWCKRFIQAAPDLTGITQLQLDAIHRAL